MTEIKTIIKFDGSATDKKSMEVADLAPALIALSDLLKQTNVHFNGNRAGLKILVNADLEQNCFELGVQLTQTIWENVSTLISDEHIVTAKEIAEWIGIIAGSGVSLYGLIKFLKGRKVKDVTVLKQKDGRNDVQINIEGDANHVVVSQPVYEIYSHREARKKAVEVLDPLKKDGYERLEFYRGKTVYETFRKSEVPDMEAGELPEVIPTNIIKSRIRTTVRIRKPAYEGRSKWTLVYRKALEAAIEDEEWLLKFQNNEINAPPNSALDVELEEIIVTNVRGEAIEEPVYSVKKVYDVVLPPQQLNLPSL